MSMRLVISFGNRIRRRINVALTAVLAPFPPSGTLRLAPLSSPPQKGVY